MSERGLSLDGGPPRLTPEEQAEVDDWVATFEGASNRIQRGMCFAVAFPIIDALDEGILAKMEPMTEPPEVTVRRRLRGDSAGRLRLTPEGWMIDDVPVQEEDQLVLFRTPTCVAGLATGLPEEVVLAIRLGEVVVLVPLEEGDVVAPMGPAEHRDPTDFNPGGQGVPS